MDHCFPSVGTSQRSRTGRLSQSPSIGTVSFGTSQRSRAGRLSQSGANFDDTRTTPSGSDRVEPPRSLARRSSRFPATDVLASTTVKVLRTFTVAFHRYDSVGTSRGYRIVHHLGSNHAPYKTGAKKTEFCYAHPQFGVPPLTSKRPNRFSSSAAKKLRLEMGNK